MKYLNDHKQQLFNGEKIIYRGNGLLGQYGHNGDLRS